MFSPPAHECSRHCDLPNAAAGAAVSKKLPVNFVAKLTGVIDTWHTDQQRDLPLGSPMLMMGFIADGQIDEQLLAARDRRFDVSSTELRQKRADISYPPIDAQADAWSRSIVMQLQMVNAGQQSSRAGAQH